MAQVAASMAAGELPQPASAAAILALVAAKGLPYPPSYVRAALRRATRPSHCRRSTVHFTEHAGGYALRPPAG
jgi:hypothetical protein